MHTHKTIAHRNVRLSCLYMKYRKFIPKGLRPILEQKFIYGISPQAYDFYMSLGENCLPATSLKQVNLRKFSGPFDWIAKSDFSDRVLQIESEFTNALNYEDLVFDLDRKTDNRHNACSVKNSRTGYMYPHDFQDDSQECYLKQKAKYQRRQERMYALAQGANGLFLYSDFGSGCQYSNYSQKVNEYFALMERLRKKLQLQKFSLILAVKADSDMATDFVDVYERDSMKLLIQAVPSKYLHESYDMFDWPSVYLKRAIKVATDIELQR